MTRAIALGCAVVFVLVVLSAVSGTAAAPGQQASVPPAPRWTRITGPNDSNTREVTLARTANGTLHVAWLREKDRTADLLHATIGADGVLAGETQPMVSGWKSLAIPGLVVQRDGTLLLLFGGVKGTGSANDPYNAGSLYTATSPADGTTWTIAPGKQSDAENVYLGPIAGAINSTGTIATAWAASDTLQAQLGLGQGKPRTRIQQSCCPYQPGLGVDGATGEIVVGWYSNDTAHLGVNAQVIAPATKDAIRAPGSVTQFNGRPESMSIDQRIPVSGRIGAPGVYLAYCGGYPTFNSVNLWRYGDEKPVVVAKMGSGRGASVTAGPEGRLWVTWASEGKIFSVRSNRAVTRFGAPTSAGAPMGTESIYRTTGEGSPGPLDVFAHVATAGAGAGTWHARVYPALEMTAIPRAVVAAQGGTVTLSVTDVGDPVAGATIAVGGATLPVGADGKATYQVAKGTKPGTIRISASASGYRPATATVIVK